jgi:hypothetical protein
MDKALAAIHHANPRRLPVSLEFGSHQGAVGLYVRYPPDLKAVVEGQLANGYPDCKLQRLDDSALDSPNACHAFIADLRLRPEVFSLRGYARFEDILKRKVVDPLTGLLATLTRGKNSSLHPRITIELRPARRLRCRLAERTVRRLKTPFFASHPFLAQVYARAVTHHRWLVRQFTRLLVLLLPKMAAGQPDRFLRTILDDADEKSNGTLFEAHIRLIVFAPAGAKRLAAAKLREMAGAFGQFNPSRLVPFELSRLRRIRRLSRPRRWRSSLLSTSDVATREDSNL